MWELLRTFEAGDFSTWLREGDFLIEPFATFYVLLAFHAIGMAAVVGICMMLTSRILGFQLSLSLAAGRQLLQVAWWGFYLNLTSGILLVMAQPRREALTPLFWAKMVFVVLAVLWMRTMAKGLSAITPVTHGGGAVEIVPQGVRVAAMIVTIAWLLAIISGLLVGYTQPPPPL